MPQSSEDRRRQYQRKWWAETGKFRARAKVDRSSVNAGFHVVDHQASGDVLAERERRLAAPHRSLTAEHFGDPRIGYSALDRMGEGIT